MAGTQVSMSLRMRLHWLHSKGSGNGLQFHHIYRRDLRLGFSRDGGVKFYSLFQNRMIHLCKRMYSFWGGLIS